MVESSFIIKQCAFFFKALNQNEAMIERIKKDDKTAFDAFVVEIQRQNILKGKNNE